MKIQGDTSGHVMTFALIRDLGSDRCMPFFDAWKINSPPRIAIPCSCSIGNNGQDDAPSCRFDDAGICRGSCWVEVMGGLPLKNDTARNSLLALLLTTLISNQEGRVTNRNLRLNFGLLGLEGDHTPV